MMWERSDIIVKGTLTYKYARDPLDPEKDENGLMVGELVPASIEKGGREDRYKIHQPFLSYYCTGAGWEPGSEAENRPFAGRFFLRRSTDGTYTINKFEP